MGEWQPIETAPRDGKFVMLFVRYSETPVFAKWGDLSKKWMAVTEFYEVHGDAWLDDVLDKEYVKNYVTHWMPLPAPPLEGK